MADCFARLLERLPGVVDPSNYKRHVDQPVTVEEFRALLRSRKYDIVHFAGHGRYDAVNPDRSCWMFTDGPLYAFELRQTLANAEVRPWLIYGSACEGARDGGDAARLSRRRVRHGERGAVAGRGRLCRAVVEDQRYGCQEHGRGLLRGAADTPHEPWRSAGAGAPQRERGRTQPRRARHAVRAGNRLGQEPVTPRSAGWAGMVLYGDPTPTVLQRLSPSDTGASGRSKQTPDRHRRRTQGEMTDAESGGA